jgi:tetratricopeptide (TPR) repeat protein
VPSASRLDASARGRLLWGRATTDVAMGHPEGARSQLAAALRLAEEVGDEDLAIRATASLSYVSEADDWPRLRAALEDGSAWFQRRGDLMGAAYSLAALGQLVMRSGDVDGVAAVYEQCLRFGEQIENDHLQTLALHQLGFGALLHGQPERARELFEASLAANTDLLDQEGVSYCLDGLAVVARTEGRWGAAAQLFAAAERLRGVLGLSAWPVLEPFHAEGVEAVRAALGPDRFAREWAVGAGLRPVDALARARDRQPDVVPAG